MTAAIVIVAYRSDEVIADCLDACLKFAPEASIIVVDNGGSERIKEVVAARLGVRLISNDVNRGFAGGVNQGFAASTAGCVLILNPDTRIETGIGPLIDECAAGGGIVCGKLTGGDGEPQTGFMVRRFPTAATMVLEVLGINRLWKRNPVNVRYRCLDFDPERPADVEQPAGAFMMVRRDVWSALGGFDEEFYPVWFEDVDFCLRARDRGYPVRYVPSVLACHAGAHSVGRLNWSSRQLYWYVSLLKWACKHLRRPSRSLVAAAVALGFVPRVFVGIVRERNCRPVLVAGRVFRSALACLFTGRLRAAKFVPSAVSRGPN